MQICEATVKRIRELLKRDRLTLYAVSYTHLDVYKRQVISNQIDLHGTSGYPLLILSPGYHTDMYKTVQPA